MCICPLAWTPYGAGSPHEEGDLSSLSTVQWEPRYTLSLPAESLRLSLLTQDLCEQVARTVPSQNGCISLVGGSLVPASADLVGKRPGLCRLDITVPWKDCLPSDSGLDAAGHPLAPSGHPHEDAAAGTASATTISGRCVHFQGGWSQSPGGCSGLISRALDGLVSGSLVERKAQCQEKDLGL